MAIVLSLTIRLQFAIECLQISKCSNRQGVGHFRFGVKFGEEGVNRCKPNFNAMWEIWALSCAKEIRLMSSVIWAQCTID